MDIPSEYGEMNSAVRYAVWLDELAGFLVEKDSIFACDCDAYQESDTGAWIHDDKCALFMQDHAAIILRDLAAWLRSQV